MAKIMKNYKIVDACAICNHHLYIDFGEDMCCYCNFDKTFKEEYFYNFFSTYVTLEEGKKWRVKHIVARNGICDNFCLTPTNKIDVL